jgi:hypothetical protein
LSDKIAGLTPTYLWVRWRTQGYIVLGRKVFCLLVDFSESYFVSIDGKTLLATQNRWGAGICITLNGFLYINIHGRHLSQLTIMDEALFCIVSWWNIFFFVKRFSEIIARAWEKSLICWIYFWVMTRVWTGENYISFPNSRETVDYTMFLFHLICEKNFDIFRCFEVLIEKIHSMLIEVYLWLWKWFEVIGGFENDLNVKYLRNGLKGNVKTWCWLGFLKMELGVDQVFLFYERLILYFVTDYLFSSF